MKFTDTISVDAEKKTAEARLFVDPQADYLKDHFPEFPTLPGLLMLEAAVRAASRLWRAKSLTDDGQIFGEQEGEGLNSMQFARLARVDRLSIARRVSPNETLKIQVEFIADEETKADEAMASFAARASVAGENAMRASFRLQRKI